LFQEVQCDCVIWTGLPSHVKCERSHTRNLRGIWIGASAGEIPWILHQFRAQADFPILTSEQLDQRPIICAFRDNRYTRIEHLQLQKKLFDEERLSRSRFSSHENVRVCQLRAEGIKAQESCFTCACQKCGRALISASPRHLDWNEVGRLSRQHCEVPVCFA